MESIASTGSVRSMETRRVATGTSSMRAAGRHPGSSAGKSAGMLGLVAVLLLALVGCEGGQGGSDRGPPAGPDRGVREDGGAASDRGGGSDGGGGADAGGGRALPEFIPSMRSYGGGGYDDFQYRAVKDLGLTYIEGLVDFTWGNIQRGSDSWKWEATDQGMDRMAAEGLKVIAFFMCPKSPGMPWDESILRTDPRFRAEYEKFAYQVTNRYKNHPAWSGLAAVWGGSADVWDHDYPATDPEVVVPLLNAAYDGIKRADPTTIVAGFNFATTAHSTADWEEYHLRAFAVGPRFDWYGLQTHGAFATELPKPGMYEGVQGIANLRAFLDAHGYADKPIWQNEAGFMVGDDIGGIPQQIQAEQAAESYIVSRTLDVKLRGWVYFELFGKTHAPEDMGIMQALDEVAAGENPAPRPAYDALRTLFRTVRFYDYRFDARLAGEAQSLTPAWVLRFVHGDRPTERLWVVFSPRLHGDKTNPREPVTEEVTIDVAPATTATLIDLYGAFLPVSVDASGKVKLISTASPVYLRAGSYY